MIAFVFVLWAAVAPAAAPAPDHIDRLGRWVNDALSHQPGDVDDRVVEVGSWPNGDLQTLWIDLSVLADLLRNPRATHFTIKTANGRTREIRYSQSEFNRLKDIVQRVRDASVLETFLLRGALLESDAAMNVRGPSGPLGSTGRLGPERFTVRVGDGRAIDMGSMAVHWDIARMLIDRSGRNDTTRLWYRATTAWMQQQEDHDVDHVAHALEVFRDDPELLFLHGCLHELLASPQIQTAIRVTSLPSGFSINVGSARTELHQAENSLRRAVALKPDFAEAHLHYGRVLDLLDDHQTSIAELSTAAASLKDEWLLYFADLFRGTALESAGRPDEAKAAYESAVRRYPDAQSPRIALTELARRRGDWASALKALDALLSLRQSDERDDPWWWYSVSQARNTDELLKELWKPYQIGAR